MPPEEELLPINVNRDSTSETAADEDREWILDGYRRLVDFYVRAAAQGKAVIHAVI